MMHGFLTRLFVLSHVSPIATTLSPALSRKRERERENSETVVAKTE
jgi:hypothetical protein